MLSVYKYLFGSRNIPRVVMLTNPPSLNPYQLAYRKV